MASGGREWDRNKEYWNEQDSWNGGGYDGSRGRGNDDYRNDGKRRKFNDGSYDPTVAYDYPGGQWDTSGQGQHGGFQDHDNPHGKGDIKKKLVPSEPSSHVIFLGLDPDFTESDLQNYLTGHNCSIETVTIIRERSSGASKGFGFAQFPTTEHARAFVDPLFPFIQIPPPASHGASATAAFNKAIETGMPHNGRRVKIDYSQSATPHDKGRGRQNLNDGTRDIGNSQAPVLLFRGLDPLSGPQAIYQAMRLSEGIGKEGAKNMKRIILIKDKVTLQSFGFAFVEFIDNSSAAVILAATMSPQIHPAGFRISDRPVAASFAHPYSFQLVADPMLRDEAAIKSSVAIGGSEGSFARYWDESATVAALEFEVAVPVETTMSEAKEKKKKVKDSAARAEKAVPAAASKLPVSDKPLTLNFGKIGSTSKSNISAPANSSTKPLSLGFSMTEDLAGEEDGAAEDAADAEVAKSKLGMKPAPLVASQKIVKNINKWNQVQEELKGDPPSESAANASSIVPIEVEFEYSDTKTKACLLCSRQFKTLEQLKRHNDESELHKNNLKDAKLRETAKRKKSNPRPSAAKATNVPEQAKYRDRASERRVMHNQPDVPLPESSSVPKKRHMEGPPRPPSPPPAPVAPGKDANNVGNKLLKAMGWTEGTGLGTEGEGRVDPITTAIYAEGVGLGASKGKEVGKYSAGYAGYAEAVRDAARDRYNT